MRERIKHKKRKIQEMSQQDERQENERNYARLMAMVYNWLAEYHNGHNWFTFDVIKNKKKSTQGFIFPGRGEDSEIPGERNGERRFWVDILRQHKSYCEAALFFYLDETYKRVTRIRISVGWVEKGTKKIHPTYKKLAEALGLKMAKQEGNLDIVDNSNTTLNQDGASQLKTILFDWLNSKATAFQAKELDNDRITITPREHQRIKKLITDGFLKKNKDGEIDVPEDAPFSPLPSSAKGRKDENSDNRVTGQSKEKKDMISSLVEQVKKSRNVVLTGAPGTGKTYLARQVARVMVLSEEEKKLPEEQTKELIKSRTSFVQFHPSYDYTDFVEGLRPVCVGEDMTDIRFERKDGTFKALCRRAVDNVKSGEVKGVVMDEHQPYVMIIDEINRGDISKIFGELFYAIDKGYRGKDGRIKTQYQNLVGESDPFFDGFYVPENVYIIATMNDIDRNVESMDFAIRRRFTWKEITPEERFDAMMDDLKDSSEITVSKEMIKKHMNGLNAAIGDKKNGLGPAYQIGPSYFREIKDYEGDLDTRLNALWTYHLKPLLIEYLRGMPNVDETIMKLKTAYDQNAPVDSNSEIGQTAEKPVE